MITTINPYNQTPIQSYAILSVDEIDQSIAKAEQAFFKWRLTSFEERASLMGRLGELLRVEAVAKAPLITEEMGKPLKQAVAEIEKCAWACDFYADHAEEFLANEVIKTQAAESWVRYDPLGVIFGIMPWNFPFWQAIRFAAPTIMAGNTVMVKHAPTTMGSAMLIEEFFEKAGFPKGVYTNLVIEVEQAEHVIAHPAIKAVTLTGSERAGSAVASLAARHIKKSVLELGGSNAFVVLEDVDIDAAVKLGIDARMQNNGQSCIAAKRFLVHESIAESFIEKYIQEMRQFISGDPHADGVTLGPLARVDLAEKLEQQVKDAVKQGAELKLGGKRNGAHYEATVLTGVQPGMTAFEEELFGPVAAFTTFKTIEEAITLSNHNNFGLGVSFCTSNPDQLKKYLHLIEDGAVFINEKVMSDPRLPFGGTKNSGFGRELSKHGILEFVNTKTIYIK